MIMLSLRRVAHPGAVTLALALAVVSPVAADPFDRYGQSFRSITPPPVGAGSFGVAGDALPDGRIVAFTGSTVFLETAPGAGSFSPAAIFDASLLAYPADPGFVRVSPSGTRIAVGAGFAKPVLIFDSSLLNPAAPATLTPADTTRFDAPHFDAAWFDDDHIALTAGDFGAPAFVSLLDVTSDPAAPINPVIITNILGAPAGVAFDITGALYTGNGFTLSPGDPTASRTGWIKYFSFSQWTAGADFETDGLLVADILSASPIRFDTAGTMLVGGGDFSAGDIGAVAVVRASAIQDSIANATPIDDSDPARVRRFDPLGDQSGFLGGFFSAATGELVITGASAWFAASGRRVGDLTGDGAVTGVDLLILLNAFGSPDPFADLNADGLVDGADLALMLNNWGGGS